MHVEPPPHEAGIIPRLLTRLVGGVCRWPRLVLAVAVLCCAASVYGSLTHLEYRTQRSELVSPRKDSYRRWRAYLNEFGDDDDIVAVVKGPAKQRLQQALEALAGRIRAQPALFDRLFYKADLRGLHSRALLYLPIDSIQSIQAKIRSMGLLLEFAPLTWRSLSLLSILQEGRRRVEHLKADGPLPAGDEQFLKQLLAITRTATATLGDSAAYRNPWDSMGSQPAGQEDLLAEPQYFFSADGGLAFLLARPIKEVSSFAAAEKSVAAMRSIVAATRAEFPDVEFGLTGLPLLESDEMVAAQRDTRLASWLSIAGISLLFLVVYRGIWYPLLTVGALLVGTAWAMGWLTLTIGHLNILTMAFAVMLIGMGDYGVLWVMRYEQARRLGMDVRSALLHTVTHVAVGNVTAAATLSLAFFAAMLADFQAIAELGWIAGWGVLLCALACFTVLPALLMLFDRRTDLAAVTIPITTQGSWLPRLSARSRWVIGAGVAVTVVVGAFAWRVHYDHNLLHLQARDLDSVKWEMTLIEHTAGASWHALSYTDSPEKVQALKARFEALPEVGKGGVIEVASLLPRDQEGKLPLLRDIQHRLHSLPQRGSVIAHGVPDMDEFDKELTGLQTQLQALAGKPLAADLRQALGDLRYRIEEVRQTQIISAVGGGVNTVSRFAGAKDFLHQPPTMDDVAEYLQRFDERLAGDLAESLHRLRDVSTPAEISLADLPPPIRERYLGKTGKWLLRVFAKQCLWDFEPLERFVEKVRTVDPEATGKPFETVEGLRGMKSGFQRAGLYALLAIVAVLIVDFRRPRCVLIALTPLAMGVVLTLGLMGLFGVPLNPANMIAFPLILGVGIDNGVHVLHDYLIRRREGKSTISYAIGRGVLVKALTTMIGFGALMISTQRGLVSLGFILTLGVGCCMVTSLLFLPAVLTALGRRRQTRHATAHTEPALMRQAA